MNHKITKIISVYEKTKDGKPFVTKKGKSFKKQTVALKEYGENMVTVPIWQGKELLQVDDVIDGEVTTREWQDKTYYDFNWAKKDSVLDEIARLNFRQDQDHEDIQKIIKFLKEKFPAKADHPMPNFEQRPQEEVKRDAVAMKTAEDEAYKPYKSEDESLDELAEQVYEAM